MFPNFLKWQPCHFPIMGFCFVVLVTWMINTPYLMEILTHHSRACKLLSKHSTTKPPQLDLFILNMLINLLFRGTLVVSGAVVGDHCISTGRKLIKFSTKQTVNCIFMNWLSFCFFLSCEQAVFHLPSRDQNSVLRKEWDRLGPSIIKVLSWYMLLRWVSNGPALAGA